MKTAKSRSEASLAPAPAQYASTPHLFVFQSNEDAAVLRKPEPIYQSTQEVGGGGGSRRLSAAQAISEKYDSFHNLARDDEPLAVADADVSQIEAFFGGHKTQVIVCRALANMYLSSEANSWELKYTGIPALVVDPGEARSRGRRQVQLVLAEKGTSFMLWRDLVDALSAYAAPDPSFHTMHLSTDRRQRVGLSFDDVEAARAFQTQLATVCADGAAAAAAAAPAQRRRRKKERPRKEDISQPCCFQHVNSVTIGDMDRFYTLQSLIGSRVT